MVVKIVHDELIRVLAGDGAARCAEDRQPARDDPDGRPARLGQDHDHRQARQAAEGKERQAGPAGLARHQPPGRDGAACRSSAPRSASTRLPIVKGETAVQIAKRAKTQANLGGYDVVFLDTAGRLHIDEVLMDEVQAVRDIAQPRETLLVVDGLTGQDAVNVATEFDGKVGISGVVLTRMDGDGRGGAALSMRAVTGKPIRFVGLGEKMDALETFEADRVAGRILGMGDIVALVEKAQETFEAEQAERMVKRLPKGLFNMNDLKMQLEQMLKMGGMQGLMGMMPGMGKMQAGRSRRRPRRQDAAPPDRADQLDDQEGTRQPRPSAASRKKRIAAGAGLDVSDLNRF